jgi:hypothetical protein
VLGNLVLIATVLAAPAAAQAQTIEQARAHAGAVIERADAGRWFTNITTSDTPTVRHVPSGMTCEFVGGDDRDVIRIYQQGASDLKPGDDVSCGTWIGRTYVTMFATRWPQKLTEEEAFASAIRSLRTNWPEAVSDEGPFEILLLEGQTSPQMAVFAVDLEGQASRSVVMVRHIGEWSFKARATGPGDDDTAVEFGTMQFALSLPGGLEAAAAARSDD